LKGKNHHVYSATQKTKKTFKVRNQRPSQPIGTWKRVKRPSEVIVKGTKSYAREASWGKKKAYTDRKGTQWKVCHRESSRKDIVKISKR